MVYDVAAIGELLIDFTSSGDSERGNPEFEANPGGAPGNVLAMLAKLGHKTAFIGKVGNDMFGEMLTDGLRRLGIETSGIIKTFEAGTTLAFIRNSDDGEREFSFYRNPGADTMLREDEVSAEIIGNCKVFHFGSLSLTDEPSRSATRRAVAAAGENGALISFDPNLRPLLWGDLEEARRQIAWGCSVCDVLKVSDDELEFIVGGGGVDGSGGGDGGSECSDGIIALRERFPGIKVIFLTKGALGAEGYWGEYSAAKPAFTGINVIDTTGAGDAFFGCCLSHLLRCNINTPNQEALENMIICANAAAAIVTTRKGALLSMPNEDEILRLLAKAY